MTKKFTQEEVAQYFKEQGYTLLSEYKGANEKVSVRNLKGEEFEVSFHNFKGGRRPERYRRGGLNPDIVEDLFKVEGYSVTSPYISSRGKLEVICPGRHSWKVSYNNFSKGRRCPECNTISGVGHMSIGEQLVFSVLRTNKSLLTDIRREVVVYIGDVLHRFDFMFVYNSQHYAIEYDGEQHYGKNNWYPSPYKKDKEKDKYCNDNNISLIRVPYTISTLPSVTSYIGNYLGITLNIPKSRFNPTINDVVSYYLNHTIKETSDKYSLNYKTITKYFKIVYSVCKTEYIHRKEPYNAKEINARGSR